jgi:hypothetical protein
VSKWDKRSLHPADKSSLNEMYVEIIAFLDKIMQEKKQYGYTFRKFTCSNEDHR